MYYEGKKAEQSKDFQEFRGVGLAVVLAAVLAAVLAVMLVVTIRKEVLCSHDGKPALHAPPQAPL